MLLCSLIDWEVDMIMLPLISDRAATSFSSNSTLKVSWQNIVLGRISCPRISSQRPRASCRRFSSCSRNTRLDSSQTCVNPVQEVEELPKQCFVTHVPVRHHPIRVMLQRPAPCLIDDSSRTHLPNAVGVLCVQRKSKADAPVVVISPGY